MKIVAALVDPAGELRAFDGTSHTRGRAAIAVLSTASRVVTIDVAGVDAHLRAHGCSLPCSTFLDGAAVLRRDGRDDTAEGLLAQSGYAARDPDERMRSLLRASLRIARYWEGAPTVERAILDDTVQRNLLGLRVDRGRAAELTELYRSEREKARAEIRSVWPALDARTLRSDGQFTEAIARRFGVRLDSLAFGAAAGVPGLVVDARRRLIEFDKAASAMDRVAEGHDQVRHFFHYWAAHTGRFVASGFPLHSLPKHPRPELALLTRQREIILPDEGAWFVVRDLHALEARVLAFLADERELVQRFAADEDVYSWFASLVWPGTAISKHGPLAHLRKIGKVAVLSLGFGAGFETFVEMVMEEQPGTSVTDLEAAYDAFHRRFTRIFGEHRRAQDVLTMLSDGFDARSVRVCRAEIVQRPDHLRVRLPTGGSVVYGGVARTVDDAGRRSLWYAPRWSGKAGPSDPVLVRDHSLREMVFPDGVVRVRLMPHSLVHNIVQAAARDVVAHMQFRLTNDLVVGVAFTVHDEIVGLSRDNEADWRATQEIMQVVMGEVPPTMPGRMRGLPLASEQDDGVRTRYGA